MNIQGQKINVVSTVNTTTPKKQLANTVNTKENNVLSLPKPVAQARSEIIKTTVSSLNISSSYSEQQRLEFLSGKEFLTINNGKITFQPGVTPKGVAYNATWQTPTGETRFGDVVKHNFNGKTSVAFRELSTQQFMALKVDVDAETLSLNGKLYGWDNVPVQPEQPTAPADTTTTQDLAYQHDFLSGKEFLTSNGKITFQPGVTLSGEAYDVLWYTPTGQAYFGDVVEHNFNGKTSLAFKDIYLSTHQFRALQVDVDAKTLSLDGNTYGWGFLPASSSSTTDTSNDLLKKYGFLLGKTYVSPIAEKRSFPISSSKVDVLDSYNILRIALGVLEISGQVYYEASDSTELQQQLDFLSGKEFFSSNNGKLTFFEIKNNDSGWNATWVTPEGESRNGVTVIASINGKETAAFVDESTVLFRPNIPFKIDINAKQISFNGSLYSLGKVLDKQVNEPVTQPETPVITPPVTPPVVEALPPTIYEKKLAYNELADSFKSLQGKEFSTKEGSIAFYGNQILHPFFNRKAIWIKPNGERLLGQLKFNSRTSTINFTDDISKQSTTIQVNRPDDSLSLDGKKYKLNTEPSKFNTLHKQFGFLFNTRGFTSSDKAKISFFLSPSSKTTGGNTVLKLANGTSVHGETTLDIDKGLLFTDLVTQKVHFLEVDIKDKTVFVSGVKFKGEPPYMRPLPPGRSSFRPVVDDYKVETFKNKPVVISVSGNYSTPVEFDISLYNERVKHGQVKQSGDTFIYTPNNGFVGTDSFTYLAKGEGKPSIDNTDTGRVTINVKSVGKSVGKPEEQPDSVRVDAKETVSIDVLANHTAPDGGKLTLVSVSGGNPTSKVEIIDGKIKYTPSKINPYSRKYDYTDVIYYTVSDGKDGKALYESRINIAITGLPVRGRGLDDYVSTVENQPVIIPIYENDFLSGITPGSKGAQATSVKHGSVLFSRDHFIFTPEKDFTGFSSFNYYTTDLQDQYRSSFTGSGGFVRIEVKPANAKKP